MSWSPSTSLLPHAVALATTVLLSSCGGGGGDAAPASPATVTPPLRAVEQSDLQIAQLLYTGTPRTPVGFEEDAPGAGHVSTAHLKNTDIDASLVASQPQYELCTDDWNEALAWSEAHAQSASQYADLVVTEDTSKYFEFGRSRAGEPDLTLRERVFKCTYVNRTNANLRVAEGSAGQLNHRPLTANELQSLGEYLWQFTSYNNFGHAVLKSSTSNATTSLSHTLIIASLVRDGYSTNCDRVDVVAWRHSASTATGELLLDLETLWSFGARETAGTATLCNQ
ncbi:hypothetical protein HNQ60_001764 [Povalibacter uvarum]|uniref:Uncharacterized protein n=1 Tax=Povalibacter uvarum TaxID=732238 RepID=A0A841HJA8_9GAMM|nr:hypothetical protein [Povalibacter uvarum]MBB6092886.1 hypothetical protein [Povalibacter uvarum]